MSVEHLGEPLTGSYSIPGGEARLYERGITINGSGGEVVISFAFPMIGRPSIVTGDPTTTPLFETDAISFHPGGWQLEQLTPLIQSALAGRLSLVPTGQPAVAVPLIIGSAALVTPEVYGFSVSVDSLQERQLYDIKVLTDGDQWRIVAPHAVYHRRTWTDFAIAHITDLHVARRIDRFHELLVQAGRHKGAASLCNWNDRFRGFVRYANYLHTIGMLDIIISTGDQYDYIYEDDDDPASGGNAEFLRKLILGQAPGPTFPDVEELLVPIFMIPGNHDYRKHPYKLIFDLHLGGSIVGKDLERVKNFSGYNLPQADAQVLESGLGKVVNVSAEGAARMVEVDREIKAHKEFLADREFYVVRLDNHRISMLNSGPDEGVLTSIGDGLRHWLGTTSEDEDAFVGGSPNSEGVSSEELRMVSEALAETPDDGLFIVGLHAPLINPVDDAYSYFLRQTQRPAQQNQVHAFILRNAYNSVSLPPFLTIEALEASHPTWFAGEQDHRDPQFVKRVNSQDMLDSAVSRGRAEELIQLLAGVGSHRPADIVLSGHTHYHNEFSVRPMHTGELAFYMDFYTQNPVNYYPTKFARNWQPTSPLVFPTIDKTYIEVLPDAAPDAIPQPIDESPLKYDLKVPPYSNPLNSAPNPGAWWSEHRPLLVQTGALGPLKSPNFLSGFRVLSVKNNAIDKIHFVSIARLAENNYRLAWDEAILPDLPGPPSLSWYGVSEGSTTPGGHVTAVATGDDRITLFLADPNGGIYVNSGNYRAGWGPWQSVSEGSSTPGAPVAAVVIGDRITLFLADPGGGIYANSGNYQSGWGPWQSVSEGSTTPGGHVTAVVTGDRITLFLADPGGGIYANSSSYQSGWGSWQNVSEGSTTPGGNVTAVMTNQDRIALFVADRNGGIYTNSGNYQTGWGQWNSVAEGSSTPGAPVTAVVTGDRISLFLADPGGGIFGRTRPL